MSPLPKVRGRLWGPLDDPEKPIPAVGDSVMQRRAIGLGSARSGSDVGALNAVYARVDLTNVADLANVDVSHRLGVKPTTCELTEVTNSGGPAYASASPVSKNQWTATNCRMAISLLSGTAQAGTELLFRVGGA